MTVVGSCDTLPTDVVTRAFEPARFALGADPSADPECTEVLNPERGFRTTSNLRSDPSFTGVRDDGHTAVYGAFLIPEYVDQAIPQADLDALSASFAAARDAGIKLLPRVYYAPGADDPDAPLPQVLAHIEQVAPVLEANADVIVALHAGFVGAWGEWHSSTNNLTEPDARKAIFDALLAALPSSRSILARRPSHKQVAYEGPLAATTAFAGTPLARVGHLNDCFLASDSDMGTYADDDEKAYAVSDSAFTIVEGETCAVNPPRSECEVALSELELHHWSLLNADYNQDVLDTWQTGGCLAQIQCRLGYRFVLLGHSSPATVAPGEVLSVSLRLANDGFASMFNARPVYLVLDGPEQRAILLDADPRTWAPGSEIELCLGAEIPSDLPAGSYQLGIWMPDAYESIQGDERYAVRFANGVAWLAGVNLLDASVQVASE